MKKAEKIILFFTGFAIGVFIVVFCTYAVHEKNRLLVIYNEGVGLLEAGEYEAGIDRLEEIPNWIHYRDAQELITRYQTVLKYQYDEICPYCGRVLK